MSRLISIDPSAIQSIADFNHIRPYIGQTKTFFLAASPKNWCSELMKAIEEFDQNSQKRILEFITHLKAEKSLYRAGYSDESDDFITNAINHLQVDQHLKLVIANKTVGDAIKTFQDLTNEDLDGPKSFSGSFSDENSVWFYLELYAKTAGRLAIVSRHNNLFDSRDRPSLFSKHLCKLVAGVNNAGCHEIIIFTTRSEDKYPEQRTQESLKNALMDILNGIKLPTYGVRMIVCDEKSISRETDLHGRLIVTNHVVLNLSDNLGGRTRSQSISVEPDSAISKFKRSLWLEMEHGLDVYMEVKI